MGVSYKFDDLQWCLRTPENQGCFGEVCGEESSSGKSPFSIEKAKKKFGWSMIEAIKKYRWDFFNGNQKE